MLTIHPIESKEQQKEFCQICNIPYLVDALAYAAYVGGNFVGMSQFSVCDEYGIIHHLVLTPDSRDIEALFILGRQTLNWIDLLGLHTTRTTETSSVGLEFLGLLGFKKGEDGYLSADTTHMFEGKCGGHCNLAEELKKIALPD